MKTLIEEVPNQPCLTHHLEKLRELNVSEEDIKNAIEIGFMVEKGALSTMRHFIDKFLNQSQTKCESCSPLGSSSKCCG